MQERQVDKAVYNPDAIENIATEFKRCVQEIITTPALKHDREVDALIAFFRENIVNAGGLRGDDIGHLLSITRQKIEELLKNPKRGWEKTPAGELLKLLINMIQSPKFNIYRISSVLSQALKEQKNEIYKQVCQEMSESFAQVRDQLVKEKEAAEARLREDTAALEQKLQELDQQVAPGQDAEKEKQLGELRAAVETARVEIAHKAELINAKESAIQSQQGAIDLLRATLAEKEAEQQRIKLELARKQAEIDATKRRLEESRLQLDASMAEGRRLREDLDKTRQELEQSRMEYSRVDDSVADGFLNRPVPLRARSASVTAAPSIMFFQNTKAASEMLGLIDEFKRYWGPARVQLLKVLLEKLQQVAEADRGFIMQQFTDLFDEKVTPAQVIERFKTQELQAEAKSIQDLTLAAGHEILLWPVSEGGINWAVIREISAKVSGFDRGKQNSEATKLINFVNKAKRQLSVAQKLNLGSLPTYEDAVKQLGEIVSETKRRLERTSPSAQDAVTVKPQ